MKANVRYILKNDLQLESCGQKDNDDIHNHKNGCYIRFTNEKCVKSKPRDDCSVDYDKDGKIVGIEFYEGL